MKTQLLFIVIFAFITRMHSQTTYVVNSPADLPDINLNDSVCADAQGNCTLRAAIQNANKTGDKDIIEFDISGNAPFVITVTDVMHPIQQPVIIDGRTQLDYINSPIIEIDGSNLTGNHNGLQLIGSSDGSEIYGLSIGGFKQMEVSPYSFGFGVYSNTGNHIFQSNYIGIKPDGTTVNSNTGGGLYFNNSGGNIIGGDLPNQGNVISGNTAGGLTFSGTSTNSEATNNLIQGNLIGTDATGTLNRGNRFNVQLIDAPNNVLGGDSEGARNIISGAFSSVESTVGTGVAIVGSESYGNSVIGNYIGTDITGTQAIPNVRGGVLVLFGANNNNIGTDNEGEGNLISGNGQYGIYLQGSTASPVVSNSIKGNYIGVDVTGNVAMPNSAGIMMLTGENNNNIIGGTTTNSKNVISGNTIGIGIRFGKNNQILGNYIGTNALGSAAVPNNIGINIEDGNNSIGGQVAGSRNVISGNTTGIYFEENNSSGCTVKGNYIGLDASGTAALPNTTGIWLAPTSVNISIGGTDPLDRNIISGNSGNGISIWGTSISIQNNYIGLNALGDAAIPNVTGVRLMAASTYTTIGGASALERNIISGNSDIGMFVSGESHSIKNNYIGLNPEGDGIIKNGNEGLVFNGTSPNTQVSENTISGNGTVSQQAKNVNFIGADNIHFFNNKVGTLPDGNSGVENLGVGLMLNNSSNNIIGGSSPNEANVFGSHNLTAISVVMASNSNTIGYNKIGIGADGTTNLGNGLQGISVTGANTGNAITKNTIANNQKGVELNPALGIPTQVTISENSIFSNSVLGIDLVGTTENDVDDADSGVNNLQNTPEISAIVNLGDDALEVTYSVPSSIVNSAYPMVIEFFGAANGQGKFFIEADSYSEPGDKTVTLNLPTGYNVDDYLTIVATATDANGNTSEFGVSTDSTLSIEQLVKRTFKLYPNPVFNKLFVQAPSSGSYDLKLVNTLGQVVLKQNNNKSSIEVNVSNLTKGLYFLNITSEEGDNQTIKFIKN